MAEVAAVVTGGTVDWSGLDEVLEQYEERWGVVDRVLYDLCRDRPGHTRLSDVQAKVALVGRGYATRIESLVPKAGRAGAGSAISLVADEILKARETWDGELHAIGGYPRLDEQSAVEVCLAHGRLTTALRDQLGGKKSDAPKSFVSKYLHFHCPIVPIYDSYASRASRDLRALAAASESMAEGYKEHAGVVYQSYWLHCMGIVIALEDADANLGRSLTVKQVDAYLLR